ncbi:MAG: AbrB/MazE/SpoVT family DNA-binding domain-containing protein [Azospirillaceae bacterium]|nr:AbrB/MazE/SpoVT family DNA-binding domain-containing protein [Azospirillaceae bacterium]
METTRPSSKGQVILPKSVRDAHHWRADRFVTFDENLAKRAADVADIAVDIA